MNNPQQHNMDNAFDSRIKSALENFEVPYDASSWGVLEQRLERLPGHTDAVDKAVRGALAGAALPYEAAHWDMLAKRISMENRRRRRVIYLKIMEAAAVALLLLWAMPAHWKPDALAETPLKQPAVAAPDAPKKVAAASGLPMLAPKEKIVRKYVYSNALLPPTGNPDAAGYVSENDYLNAAANALLSHQNELSGLGNDAQNIDNQNNGTTNSSTNIADGNGRSADFALFDLLGKKALVHLNADQTPKTFAPITRKAARQSRMYLAALASFDQNRIKTSAPGRQSTRGYGAGLVLGLQKGKWGLETGLSYHRKQYTPRKQVEIIGGNINTGYFGQYVQNVDADVLSVPVRAVHQIARLGSRTRVKATAGLVANVVLDKSYAAKNVFYPGAQPLGQPDPPKFSAEYNGKGILENGGLDGNAYVNLSGGLRLEHALSPRAALFAEAGLQQPLGGGKGIGPKPSRIQTLVLQAGVLQRM